jgi:anti-sigma-K factor RskA
MIDEAREERASLYVFGLLEPEEAAAFEQEIAADTELRDLVDELRETAATIACTAPLQELPAGLEAKILQQIAPAPKIVAFPKWAALLPLAIAACLAVACLILFRDVTHLRQRVAELETRDVLAQLKIATLTSQQPASPSATAVILWDASKQRGVLKVSGVPANRTGTSYQLWVVDPKYKDPVNGGVFAVDATGTTKISFQPDAPINSVKAFAVSLERAGGVPKAQGPMVLAGQ